mmetsp:Transcript_64764/g.182671  ORF Transcript_64764/g.182671 Transcript_64764/m.182671 type:complete len:295 (+) Transcript_64764:94-978(+)
MGAIASIEACSENTADSAHTEIIYSEVPQASTLMSPCCSTPPSYVSPRNVFLPRLINVVVPRGPAYTSGLYLLVDNETPNGYPLWKATQGDLWLYSMTTGKWGIGGKVEHDAGFQAGAAFVFCDQCHFGEMPHRMDGAVWFHNRPAWTPDTRISVQSWSESTIVTLQRGRISASFGIATKVVGGRLKVTEIDAGSSLDDWIMMAQAEERTMDVVDIGSRIVRVDTVTEPRAMQEALATQLRVQIEFSRPCLTAEEDKKAQEEEERLSAAKVAAKDDVADMTEESEGLDDIGKPL